ncbi:hypothetical protein LIER_20890 [Lithospermum erythrorhizon]|uniref:Uncharacterized protein n=1 Tax=Lithospermum erythrorhizon TaxID=34254 RepID=A0AAV3QN49_LITER
MGCFLACFGYTKKRKRPKCCTKIISSNQVHVKYVPLDSELPHTQNFKNSGSEKKEKTNKQSSLKVKKKVSFNLDVKTYEPLNYADEIDNVYLSEGEEETKWEFDEEETQRANMVGWHHQKDKGTSYRYQNIHDFYDEEDEIMVEGCSLDDDDDDIFDDEEGSDLDNNGDEEDGTIINDHQETEATMDDLMPSSTLAHEEPSGEDSSPNVRNRSRYACSVLNPVENLAQWKSIKAKDRLQRKRQKETIISEQERQVPEEAITSFSHSKPLQHEIAVNASLANWLLTTNDELATKV